MKARKRGGGRSKRQRNFGTGGGRREKQGTDSEVLENSAWPGTASGGRKGKRDKKNYPKRQGSWKGQWCVGG